nr:O-unit flippase-like protein [Lacticaseibacillus pantheris]
MSTSTKKILWTYIGTAVSMSSNFLILPFIFKYLNTQEIGFWYILLSINGLVSLFDFGFDPSFARNIAYVWSGAQTLLRKGANEVSGDKGTNFFLLGRIIASARYIYMLLSVLATLLIAILGTVYVSRVVFPTLSGEWYYASWVVFCCSMFINLYYGYMSALLRGTGKIVEVNKSMVLARTIQLSVTIILLIFHAGFIAPVLGLLFYGISYRQFCRAFFFSDKRIKANIIALKRKIEINEIKSVLLTIWPNSWRDGLVSLSNYVVTQGTSLIAGAFMPLGQVGVYSLGVQFASSLTVGANAVSNAVHPYVQSAFVKRDFEGMGISVARTTKLYTLTTIIGSFVVYFAVFPVLHFFKHSSTPSLALFSMLMLYYFLFYLQSSFAAYIADMNEIPYMKSFVITSVIFLLISPISLSLSGGNAEIFVVVAVVCQLVYNNWKWPMFFINKIGIKLTDFFKLMLNSGIRLTK